MKTKCSCGLEVADEQIQECLDCGDLICDKCGLGHACRQSTIAEQVINDNPKTVADAQKGSIPALKFLIGQALRKPKEEAS
jgi:hypothetical protein